jgi:hypothetical protein
MISLANLRLAGVSSKGIDGLLCAELRCWSRNQEHVSTYLMASPGGNLRWVSLRSGMGFD